MLTIVKKGNVPAAVGQPAKLAAPFLEHEPGWPAMEKIAHKFNFAQKIILIANGGSVNTFRGIYYALRSQHTPEVFFIDTNEPDYIMEVRHACPPEKSLVLAISKSGENTSQIESFLAFQDYPHQAVVTGDKSVLREMAKIKSSILLLDHPNISGRFSGFTETGLLPALLAGFDAQGIAAARGNQNLTDEAWRTAVELWELEQQGVNEILLGVYSRRLSGFNLLVQQLLHETWGKRGLGFTVIPVDSPESHHHTNQRLFDGRKNMAVVFVHSHYLDTPLQVPDEFKRLEVRGRSLSDFDGLNLAKSLEAEYVGTQDKLDKLGVPYWTLDVGKITPESAGEYIMFWQLVAFYGARLRGLNPFDQPAVEDSKNIAFEERFLQKNND